MATTTRLGITKLEVAQAGKETRINTALDTIDAAIVALGLANSGEVYLTETPDATANYGVLNLGDGGFAGGAGDYAGAAGGSILAMNYQSGGTVDLVNLQIDGVSKWKLGAGGNVTLGDAVNIVLNATTGTQIGTAASQKLVLWGGTPVVRPAINTELRQSLINIGAITGGVNDLNLNGGDLTADEGKFSGALQGSGTAFTLKPLTFTWPSDANATLDATQKANVVIDIQTGVITAQRDLLVSANAGAFYGIINRNAQAVNVRIGANTGIVVASGRARFIYFPGGTNAFAMGPDHDYTL